MKTLHEVTEYINSHYPNPDFTKQLHYVLYVTLEDLRAIGEDIKKLCYLTNSNEGEEDYNFMSFTTPPNIHVEFVVSHETKIQLKTFS